MRDAHKLVFYDEFRWAFAALCFPFILLDACTNNQKWLAFLLLGCCWLAALLPCCNLTPAQLECSAAHA